MKKTEQLAAEGFLVEVQEQLESPASFRLRVESHQRLGELVVWDSAKAYLLVVDLIIGQIQLELDDVDLGSDTAVADSILDGFFRKVENR